MAASPEFTKAVTESKKLSKTPGQDEMLELYKYYKQGTQDPPYAQAPQPGTFDLKGKAKYKAWGEVKDLSPEEAQQKYVAAVEALKEKYGFEG